ncbi:Met-10+ like-protein-domain-containing protein [Limtongia smithiae]|uniref:Met-10+ like-protein-domain-containing protein n=1 Tax=Limtongia smithiae TaxID=1125753 RepID=UPI0034CF3AE5
MVLQTNGTHDNAHFTAPVNRSMTVLDRSFFDLPISLAAIKVVDPRELRVLRSLHKDDLLQLHGVSNIVKIFEEGKKEPDILLLLRPELQFTDTSGMSEGLRKYLDEHADFAVVPYTLTLGYDFWKPEEILGAILPEELLTEIPSGFTLTGHIAHMNLRDQYLPYKAIIGQVILDKNPSVRTVVNKLDTIDSVFRTFDMEILAGDNDLYVEQLESNCRFRFDFSKVYWNSRLQGEHDRLVAQFTQGEAVCDVMAGVGPFAIPAGKKNLVVLANDLNGASYASMKENIQLNKVSSTVFPYCMDGRDFIRSSVSELRKLSATRRVLRLPTKRRAPDGKHKYEEVPIPSEYSHYVMNLPHAAIEFLDAFRGIHRSDHSPRDLPLPAIHVYCFHKADADDRKVADDVVHGALRQRVAGALGWDIPLDRLSFHFVRQVSPTKSMHCITFQLPREVAFAVDDGTTSSTVATVAPVAESTSLD